MYRRQAALEDANTVLVKFEEPNNPRALVVKGDSLFFLGSFEHSLVSYHRAVRQKNVLQADKRSIETGMRRAEEAIRNVLQLF